MKFVLLVVLLLPVLGPELASAFSAAPLSLLHSVHRPGHILSRHGGHARAATARFGRVAVAGLKMSSEPGWEMGEEQEEDGAASPELSNSATAVLNSEDRTTEREQLKFKLLAAVASLDRGAAASKTDRQTVSKIVEALEAIAPPVEPFPAGLDAVDGMWRLVYSSALSVGSGSGGGASADSPRIFQTRDTASNAQFSGGGQVGQVYQRIQSRKSTLENIVEFKLTPSFLPELLGKAVISLEHRLETVDGYQNRIKIIFTKVNVRNAGGPARNLKLRPLSIPVLEPFGNLGPGVFDVIYVDSDMRLSRGDRGEVRVFVKAGIDAI